MMTSVSGNDSKSGLQGQQPQVQAAMELYHILSESDTHLRQPVALETQLLAEHLDDDVGRSMLQLLQVSPSPWPVFSML